MGFIRNNLVELRRVMVMYYFHTLDLCFCAVYFSDKSLSCSKNNYFPNSPSPLSQRETKDAKRHDVNVFLYSRNSHVDPFQLHIKDNAENIRWCSESSPALTASPASL